MLLKVSKGSRKWVMFDSVAEIEYADYQNVTAIKDGNDLVLTYTVGSGEVREELIPDRWVLSDMEAQNISGYLVVVKYIDNEVMTIFFDTVAYLCNDDGKTLERIGGK